MRPAKPARKTPRPASSQGSLRVNVPAQPRRFVFLLLERFTMMAFTSAVEPLRLANQVSGAKLYDWKLASEDGAEARASNGVLRWAREPCRLSRSKGRGAWIRSRRDACWRWFAVWPIISTAYLVQMKVSYTVILVTRKLNWH